LASMMKLEWTPWHMHRPQSQAYPRPAGDLLAQMPGVSLARERQRSSLLTLALLLRIIATTLLYVAMTAFSATHAFAQETPAGAEARIEAEATNLRNSNGSFACSLYNSPKGFPKTDESVVGNSRVKIKDGQATCVFNNMKPGVYAVAAMHDENEDGKMHYNFLGIPTEGYGFSNGAAAIFSAPSFEAAEFQYNGGVLKIRVQLKY